MLDQGSSTAAPPRDLDAEMALRKRECPEERLPQPLVWRVGGASSTSRTLRVNSPLVNGFCRNATG